MYGLSCIWALEACTHIIYRLNSVYVIVYVLRHRMASRNPRTRAVNKVIHQTRKNKFSKQLEHRTFTKTNVTQIKFTCDFHST
jgi:hypothetical protein